MRAGQSPACFHERVVICLSRRIGYRPLTTPSFDAVAHDFNHRILDETGHRPWPMPAGPWIMTQTWHDLLFAHWPVDAGIVAPKIPGPLELDLVEGKAWLAVVPFRMTNVSPRGVPSLPWVSEFPELNVRTYVRFEEKPGVYFFSLDAGNPLAVAGAKSLFHLPYFSATMAVERSGDTVRYTSERKGDPGVTARLIASYKPIGPPSPPRAGSLEHFLTERYCLYTVHDGRPHRLEIHHPPWPLQPADASIEVNTMADAAGIPLPRIEPLLHFSKRQDVVAWRLKPAGRA
jgi:uncharacterized protein